MGFEEALDDLISKYLEREGYNGVIRALELKLMKEGVIVAHANGSATISWRQIKRALSDRTKANDRKQR